MIYIGRNGNELLQEACTLGIIDLDSIKQQIEMNKRNEVISNHPYAIWFGNDGYWHTYFPGHKPKERIAKKRKDKEDLENDIVEFWKEEEENPTVSTLFNLWLYNKCNGEDIQPATKNRYQRQFDQCFKEVRNKRVKSFTSEYDIEEFIMNSIHDNQLTRKGFSNMRTLIFGIFRLAKKKHLVDFDITQVVNNMEISKKKFRVIHKDIEDEVFTEEELPVVLSYLQENPDIVNLGLLLMFKTGLRVGELAALKKEDVNKHVPNSVHIMRTEVRYEDENGKMQCEVRDFPKTENSIRDVIIPEKFMWILRRIQMVSTFGEYLFERDGERIRTYMFVNRLRTVCKKCNVKPKSPHKIRKTYASILIDGGAEESLILSQLGHKKIDTTKDYYYKDRLSQKTKSEKINQVIGL